MLCNGFVQFVLRHDRLQEFKFLTAQSAKGEALYERFGLKHGDYDTNLVFIEGKLFEKLDAFLAVMWRLGWPWRVVFPLKYLPLPLKNWLYDRIACNRYQLFGRYDACIVPDVGIKSRLLD